MLMCRYFILKISACLSRRIPPLSLLRHMTQSTIRDALVAFAAERDWDQFQTRENLAKSIVIEAGELLECFQWTQDAEPGRVREELADVLTYCHLLAIRIGADPDQIVLDKLEITRKKYPVGTAKGVSTKYDRLPGSSG